jgi:L-threonylcarbamoyladenylate synthase
MKEDIKNALEVLKRGGLILFPTDTTWGIGCDATNAEAVQRICHLKKRKPGKRMLILMENPALLDRYIDDVPDIAWDLIEISATPLTIVFPKPRNLPAELVAGDGSIGVRFTKDEFSRELIRQLRKPIVSSSANISGLPSPLHFGEVSHDILDAVDYVVSYRKDDTTPPPRSSVIRLEQGGRIEIIRE